MRGIISLCLTLIISVSVRAQIFYRITSADSDKTSYLLGTHHLAPLTLLDSIPQLPSALASVDSLYGEIDIATLSDPMLIRHQIQAITVPPDSTLDKLLSPQQLDKVTLTFARFTPGVVAQQLCMIKPAALENMLTQLFTAKLTGNVPSESIDMAMQQRANACGIPVAGLETPEQQSSLIYDTPLSLQAQSLMSVIDNPEEAVREIAALSQAYARRDMPAINEALRLSFVNDPDSFRRLVTDRNARWLNRLTSVLPRHSLMIVVGAGHLPGPEGIITGLRSAGYTIEPIY